MLLSKNHSYSDEKSDELGLGLNIGYIKQNEVVPRVVRLSGVCTDKELKLKTNEMI